MPGGVKVRDVAAASDGAMQEIPARTGNFYGADAREQTGPVPCSG